MSKCTIVNLLAIVTLLKGNRACAYVIHKVLASGDVEALASNFIRTGSTTNEECVKFTFDDTALKTLKNVRIYNTATGASANLSLGQETVTGCLKKNSSTFNFHGTRNKKMIRFSYIVDVPADLPIIPKPTVPTPSMPSPAPLSSSGPLPAPKPIPFVNSNHYEATFGYLRRSLSINDVNTQGTASVFSNFDVQASGLWRRNWGPIYSVFASGKFEYVQFNPPNNQKLLDHRSLFLAGAQAGIERPLWFEQVALSLGYDQRLFLVGITTLTSQMQAELLPSFSLKVSKKIVKMKTGPIIGTGFLSYLNETSSSLFKVNSGIEWGLGLKYGIPIFKQKWLGTATFTFAKRSQNTSLINLNESDLTFLLGVDF